MSQTNARYYFYCIPSDDYDQAMSTQEYVDFKQRLVEEINDSFGGRKYGARGDTTKYNLNTIRCAASDKDLCPKLQQRVVNFNRLKRCKLVRNRLPARLKAELNKDPNFLPQVKREN
jgi:hypothetical protein